MLRALAAILMTTSFVSTASAQSYVEENARDAVCEWSYKGKTEFGICHIYAMGMHGTGEQVFLFSLTNGEHYFLRANLEGPVSAEKGTGGFWDFKPTWKGKYTEQWNPTPSEKDYVPEGEEIVPGIHSIQLSNGLKIKMMY